jgi:sphingomyelin phosphodiesterase
MKQLNRKFYPFLFLLSSLFIASCSKDSIMHAPGEQQMNTFVEKGGSPIRVLSYNTFLLSNLGASITQWSQEERASMLGEADFLKNYDVLLLQECFDNTSVRALRENLSATFPYETPVLGRDNDGWDSVSGDWDKLALEDGGVMIASKYPIEEMKQHIFINGGCGFFESMSKKGFVYARIRKDGKAVHFIATHTQSADPGCKGNDVAVRTAQLKEIKSYIDSLNIPVTEMVMLGGDFNIIKDTPEYADMLQILQVSAPSYRGLPYTWDPKSNTMASFHYPENESEYLDYIFVSNKHLVPPSWHNVVFAPSSSTLMTYTNLSKEKYYWVDYSDHYAVEGNIYPDASTPEVSMKARKYDRMSLKSVKTGKFITWNTAKTDDWLTVSASSTGENTWFNLVNIGNENDSYYDLKEGPVRVELSERLNNFWYWGRLNGGSYYYFPAFGKSLSSLELVLVKKKNGNFSNTIEDGDIVAFRDYTGYNTYYLQVYNKDNTDWIYMNGSTIGQAEQFEVHLYPKPAEAWNL